MSSPTMLDDLSRCRTYRPLPGELCAECGRPVELEMACAAWEHSAASVRVDAPLCEACERWLVRPALLDDDGDEYPLVLFAVRN